MYHYTRFRSQPSSDQNLHLIIVPFPILLRCHGFYLTTVSLPYFEQAGRQPGMWYQRIFLQALSGWLLLLAMFCSIGTAHDDHDLSRSLRTLFWEQVALCMDWFLESMPNSRQQFSFFITTLFMALQQKILDSWTPGYLGTFSVYSRVKATYSIFYREPVFSYTGEPFFGKGSRSSSHYSSTLSIKSLFRSTSNLSPRFLSFSHSQHQYIH